MSPNRQSMEGPFSGQNDPQEMDQAALDTDAIVEDFTAFFERLSSIDDVSWDTEGGATPSVEPGWDDLPGQSPMEEPPITRESAKENIAEITSTPIRRKAPQPPTGRARANRAISRGAPRAIVPPAMQVMQSENIAPAQEQAQDEDYPGTGRSAGGYLKMVVAAVVLFSIGLGAGWAALSLPDRFKNATNEFPFWRQSGESQRFQAGVQSLMPENAREEETATEVAATKPEAPAQKATGPQQKAPRANPLAKNAQPEQAAAPAKKKQTPAPGTGLAANLPEIDLPTAEGDADATATVGQNDASTIPQGNAAVGSAQPHFEIQVGACTSFDCVENYRRLLLGKVSSGNIHVLKEPRANGTLMQRVRVGPMSRGEAQAMKESLSQSDKRFAGAYLVAVR